MKHPGKDGPSLSGPAAHSHAGSDAACASASWRVTIPAAGLIVLAGVAVYGNSLAGPFVFDDLKAIGDNRTIHRLWPIWEVLSPPPNGETVSGRPLLNLSLAINYALSGLKVWSYHVTNLLIHIAAALLLFGILRRTFLLPALRERFGQAATPLALASALLWLVHPLQTESVTYIVQRAESLAGLFYLLTLYGVIRGAGTVPFFAQGTVPFFASENPTLPNSVVGEKGDCPPSPRDHWSRLYIWYAAAVAACLLGAACKEILVTAPLIVLLYDRTLLAGSFAEAWRRRWGLYVGLAATWVLLAYLLFSTGLIGRREEMGTPDPWTYAVSQPSVILHYLWLSVWPRPLCFDYGWPVASTLGEILPGAMAIAALLAATIWGLLGRRVWGFLGAWFLLILLPTSSILPLSQLACEHRMYLSLAAVTLLAVAGGYAFCDQWLPRPTVPGRGAVVVRWAAPLLAWAAVLLALGYGTVVRNADYQTTIGIWQDTVNKRPNDASAYNNLGNALARCGRFSEAMQHFQHALRLKPNFARAHDNLGNALFSLGKINEAIEHYHQALQLAPNSAAAHSNLGVALVAVGKVDDAIAHYHEALRLKPYDADAHCNLGIALALLGKTSLASEHLEQALTLKPSLAMAHYHLAWLLATNPSAQGGDAGRAVQLAEQARELGGPQNAQCLDVLAAAYAAAGRFLDAATTAERALKLAESTGQTALAENIRSRLELYHAGRPYRRPPPSPSQTIP